MNFIHVTKFIEPRGKGVALDPLPDHYHAGCSSKGRRMRVDAFLMFSWLFLTLLILLTACVLLGLPAIVYAAPLPDFGFLLALNR